MAAFKGVKLTGRDQSIPVYSLVNADAKTSGLRLSVDRYAGGVDLGGLGWSVRVVSGSDSDIGVLTPVVSYHWITFDWTFPQIVAAHEGLTVFQVAAVDAAKGMMWQSGKYTIMVTEALTESASYTEEELSLFQQAISNATVKLNAMSTQLDGFEARITTAVGTANAAAAAANSAAATATSAAADANTAASAANTAAAGAVEIKDTLEAKLAAGEFKGEKGDKGDTGGASEESIIAAGYTVKSIKAGGTAVTPVNGVANIPIASSSSAGVLKVIPNYGIIVSSGAAAINPATEYDIREKANEYKPIVPNRLDYAVKSALTWAKRTNYSDAEKATACDTIGAAAAADLSGHTGNTDIHVTADDKAGWNAKQDAIGDLDTIRSGAAAGATALQSVPVAGVGTFGLTKPYRDNTSYGISMDANGAFINGATADDIAARTNKYKPITPFTLDAAVKAALTDDSRDTGYSDDEKANARGVIGAASDGELSEAKAAINDLTTAVNSKADKTALDATNTDLNRLWELNRGVSYDFEQDSTVGNKTIPTGARVVKPLSVGGKCEVVDGSILTADVSAVTVRGRNLWDGTYDNAGSYFTKLIRKSDTEILRLKLHDKDTSIDLSGIYLALSGNSHYPFDAVSFVLSNGVVNNNGCTASPMFKYIAVYPPNQSSIDKILQRFYVMVEIGDAYTAYTPYRIPVTQTIPTAIRSLTGYGWSAGSVCNEVDFERKKFVQRVGRVDLGTHSNVTMISVSQGTMFRYVISDISNETNRIDMLCAKYSTTTQGARTEMTVSGSSRNADFIDSTYETIEEFKNANAGVYFYYKLDTPIETDISALLTDTDPIECEEGGSVEFVNANELQVPNTVEYFVGKKPVQDVQINGTSITENGVANVPFADGLNYGVVMTDTAYGTRISNGKLAIVGATNDNIDARNNSYRTITPSNINYAIKAALTDSNRDTTYTDAQKANACDTIGAERKSTDGWVLKGTLSGTADDRGNIDTGVSVDLSGCTELIIVGETSGSGNSAITTNVTWILADVVKANVFRRFYAHFKDSICGIENSCAKFVDGNYQIMSTQMSGYAWINGKNIKDITILTFSTTSYVTSCEIKIYAR